MPDDAYTRLLDLKTAQRPPTPAQLLGLDDGVTDPAAIEEAAHRQLERLDRYAIASDPKVRAECQRLMNEVARARNQLTAAARLAEPPPPWLDEVLPRQRHAEPLAAAPPADAARPAVARPLPVALLVGAAGWAAALVFAALWLATPGNPGNPGTSGGAPAASGDDLARLAALEAPTPAPAPETPIAAPASPDAAAAADDDAPPAAAEPSVEDSPQPSPEASPLADAPGLTPDSTPDPAPDPARVTATPLDDDARAFAAVLGSDADTVEALARDLIHQADTLLRDLGPDAPDDLLADLARAHARFGDRARARALWEENLGRFFTPSDGARPPILGVFSYDYARFSALVDTAVELDAVDDFLDRLDAQSLTSRSHLQLRLISQLQFRADDPDQAQRVLRHVLSRRVGAGERHWTVLTIGLARLASGTPAVPGDPAGAFDIAQGLPDADARFTTLINVGNAAAKAGDLDTVRACLDHAEAAREEVRTAQQTVAVRHLGSLSLLAAALGDAERVERYIAEIDRLHSTRPYEARLYAIVLSGNALARLGRLDDARHRWLLTQPDLNALEPTQRVSVAQALIRAQFEAGVPDAAIDALRRLDADTRDKILESAVSAAAAVDDSSWVVRVIRASRDTEARAAAYCRLAELLLNEDRHDEARDAARWATRDLANVAPDRARHVAARVVNILNRLGDTPQALGIVNGAVAADHRDPLLASIVRSLAAAGDADRAAAIAQQIDDSTPRHRALANAAVAAAARHADTPEAFRFIAGVLRRAYEREQQYPPQQPTDPRHRFDAWRRTAARAAAIPDYESLRLLQSERDDPWRIAAVLWGTAEGLTPGSSAPGNTASPLAPANDPDDAPTDLDTAVTP